MVWYNGLNIVPYVREMGLLSMYKYFELLHTNWKSVLASGVLALIALVIAVVNNLPDKNASDSENPVSPQPKKKQRREL
jgi:hypothetical protein